MSVAVSRIEQAQFAKDEAVIERGLATFVEVGAALMRIRDSRSYRQDYATFESYCKSRWSMTPQQANRLVAGAEIVRVLEPIGSTPSTESQVRPLTRLEPEGQKEAWKRAGEIAEVEGTPVRARHVEKAVQERTRKPVEEYHLTFADIKNHWQNLHDQVGQFVDDTIALDALTPAQRKTVWQQYAAPMIGFLNLLSQGETK